MGDGKRESNGCTVHFNSILQLLYIFIYINHKVSIKLWLNLKSAKKHLSFFFFFFLHFCISYFLLHLNITRVSFFLLPILKSALLFKLLLDRTAASWRIQHFFSWLLWNEGITTMTITTTQRRDSKWSERNGDFHATRSHGGVQKSPTPLKDHVESKPSSTKTCCSHGRTQRHLLTLFTFIKEAESFSAVSHFTHLTLT